MANKLIDIWNSCTADVDIFKGVLLLLLILSAGALSSSAFFFVIIFTVMALWQVVFAKSRAEPIDWRFFYSASLLTLLLPIDLPLWQLVLCTSLGVVFGEQIYGGRAHSFLSSVVVSLAFILYAFPHDSSALIDDMPIVWLLLPAAILILLRMLDWMTLIGMVLGIFMALLLTQASFNTLLTELAITSTTPASFGLCVVFILCDTRLAARTLTGKWISGALFGLLIVYLNPTFAKFDQLVFTLLLTSIAVPLIDALAQGFGRSSQQATDKGPVNE